MSLWYKVTPQYIHISVDLFINCISTMILWDILKYNIHFFIKLGPYAKILYLMRLFYIHMLKALTFTFMHMQQTWRLCICAALVHASMHNQVLSRASDTQIIVHIWAHVLVHLLAQVYAHMHTQAHIFLLFTFYESMIYFSVMYVSLSNWAFYLPFLERE